MKYVSLFVLLVSTLYSQSIPADTNEPAALSQNAVSPDEQISEPVLPQKDTTEYWVVRTEAVQEFIPFLTKKRSEMKIRQKMLADYLLEIGKASEFADQKSPIAYDPKVYAEILRIGPGLQKMNVEAPQERPTWDQLVEIAMQHVLFEGYLPVDVEETEREQFIAACKKKEEYGQKVRADVRTIMDQCARMWVYLDQIGRLGDFKSQEVDVALQQKADVAARRAAMMQEKQQASLARAEDRRQQEYEEKMARREFSSSRRERYYQSRQDQLLYRQSRLDERYANSRAYYY